MRHCRRPCEGGTGNAAVTDAHAGVTAESTTCFDASPQAPFELAPHGIRVVAICPTGVNTPMNDGLAELEGASPLEIAERSAGNLLPVPWIEAEDVAEAVLFVASDGATYVTGSTLVVDAGLLTR